MGENLTLNSGVCVPEEQRSDYERGRNGGLLNYFDQLGSFEVHPLHCARAFSQPVPMRMRQPGSNRRPGAQQRNATTTRLKTGLWIRARRSYYCERAGFDRKRARGVLFVSSQVTFLSLCPAGFNLPITAPISGAPWTLKIYAVISAGSGVCTSRQTVDFSVNTSSIAQTAQTADSQPRFRIVTYTACQSHNGQID